MLTVEPRGRLSEKSSRKEDYRARPVRSPAAKSSGKFEVATRRSVRSRLQVSGSVTHVATIRVQSAFLSMVQKDAVKSPVKFNVEVPPFVRPNTGENVTSWRLEDTRSDKWPEGTWKPVLRWNAARRSCVQGYGVYAHPRSSYRTRGRSLMKIRTNPNNGQGTK